MRISSQNNQFIFNLPDNFINERLEEKFVKMMYKNMIPYNSVSDYINSTIKDVVFPNVSYETVQQYKYHGKSVNFRSAGNVMDRFQSELDITFRSVDSHTNYFFLLQILTDFYLNRENYLDLITFDILDKDGDALYTIILKQVLYKSLSENRLSYYATSFEENTFTLTFQYNFIDILWRLDEDVDYQGDSVFDIPENVLKEPDPRDISKLQKEHNIRKLN